MKLLKVMAGILTVSLALTACAPVSGITVVSREEGSGTRGAFVELFKIEEKDDQGNKVDKTTEDAMTTNNTSVMLTTVAGDKEAIGYVSLGSMNDTVTAVSIDGAQATVEKINSGEYKIARPFNIVLPASPSVAAQDFVSFILSADGQKVIEDSGYIKISDAGAYTGSASGKLIIAGSSSVSPVMEKLKEAYAVLNPDVQIQVQQNDSTTGINSVKDGICDIGMASRELKDSEKDLTATTIAMDGIAVIVNNENTVKALTSEQVKSIFTGEVTEWSKLK